MPRARNYPAIGVPRLHLHVLDREADCSGHDGKSGAAPRERDEESARMHSSCRSASAEESATKRRLVDATAPAADPLTGAKRAFRKAWLPGAQAAIKGERGVTGDAGGDAGNRVCASCGHAFSSFFAHNCSAR